MNKKLMNILKKRFIMVILFSVTIMAGKTFSVQAADEQGFSYNISNGEATITGFAGGALDNTIFPNGAVTIPDTLGGAPVVAIGNSAFKNMTAIKSLNFSTTKLTVLGTLSFYGCTGLTTVTLPQGLTSIGVSAFDGCNGLTTVNFPQGLTSIGDYAFWGCTGLTTVNLPQGLTSIGDYAFFDCTGLTTVNLPQGLTSIGDYAFGKCTGLTTVNLPQGLNSIGDYAFSFCTGLTTVNLPQGLTSIGNYAFTNCTKLTTVNFPQGLNSIGDSAFYSCTGITTVNLPKELNSIGASAFQRNDNLRSIFVHYNLKSEPNIAQFAFSNTSNITVYGNGNDSFKDNMGTIGTSSSYVILDSSDPTITSIDQSATLIVLNNNPPATIEVNLVGTNFGSTKNCSRVLQTDSSQAFSLDSVSSNAANFSIPTPQTDGIYNYNINVNLSGGISYTWGVVTVNVIHNPEINSITPITSTSSGLQTITIDGNYFTPYNIMLKDDDGNQFYPISASTDTFANFNVNVPNEDGTYTYKAYYRDDKNNIIDGSQSSTFSIGAPRELTTTAGTGGAVSTGGTYTKGTNITITAAPIDGYKFLNWTSSKGGTFANANSAATTFTMPGNDVTVTANFTLNTPSGGGGSSSGGGSNYVSPKKIPADSGKVIDAKIAATKDGGTVMLSTGDTESIDITADQIKAISRRKISIGVQAQKVITIIPSKSKVITDNKSLKVNLQNYAVKANTTKYFNEIDKMNSTLLDKTNSSIQVLSDGKISDTNGNVKYDLSGFKLTDEQIGNLVGVKTSFDGKYTDLYGTYDKKTKTFSVSIDKTGNYGVAIEEPSKLPNEPKHVVLVVGSTNFKVNDNGSKMEVAPVIVNNTTYVPVRFVSEAIGAKIDWNPVTNTATISLDGKTIDIVSGKDNFIKNGRMMIPLRYISENLGAIVKWDGDTQTIDIMKR